MKCRKVRPYLVGYSKHELTPKETAGIKAHLEGCPDCAREMEEISQMNLLMGDGLQTFVPSDNFNQKLLTRIQTISSVSQVKDNRKWWHRFLHEVFPSVRLRWAVVGAVSVIILAMIVTFTQRRVPVGPESLTLDTTITQSQNLVSLENIEDSSYLKLLERLGESSLMRNKSYVIDNFTSPAFGGISNSPNKGEDGRIRPEDLHRRFIIEKGVNPVPAGTRNHYVLPVVSTQTASEKTDY